MSAVYYHFRKYFSSWPTEHFFLFIWTLNFIKILSEYMAMIECSFLDLEIYCLLKKKKKKTALIIPLPVWTPLSI